MYPNAFDYAAPTSLAEALTLLGSGSGETKVLAGGQSLLPLMKLRLASPEKLVDLRKIAELRGIREDGGALVIGAMTTYYDVLTSAVAAKRAPLLVEAVGVVGDRQVRARGTIGGSLAHADPAGDLPAVMLALNAEVTVAGSGGTRVIPIRDFFVDMLTTSLKDGEIVTSIKVPASDGAGTGSAYAKHAHPASGYAVVGVAAVVRLGAGGVCEEARVAITGAGAHATRASGAEQALTGKPLDEATIAAAAAHAADGVDLLADTYASAAYRGHLVQVLTKRALATAAGRARG